MAIRKILRAGHPLLREVSQQVPPEEIRSQEIKKLIRDMFDTMDAANGVGLAAPQIGVLKRIVVAGFDRSDRYPELKERKMEFRVMINPEIKILNGDYEGFWEGCLSVPDMRGYVERIRNIQIQWFDEKEEHHKEIVTGFDAVVYQHECDHLDGILYIDRLKDPKMFGYNDELDLADSQDV
ncbi:MAG: peptide deformylase [Spirochaetia bacterium]|nr:peptide deformylase [Spirochaetia bacterium]